MGNNDINDLLKLSATERLAIAERLFSSVASEAESTPLDEAEHAFVTDRLSEHRISPNETLPWADVKKAMGL